MKKYDVDIFTYFNLKYWNPDERKTKFDKINDYVWKVFEKVFSLNGYGEKISNKLMELLTKEK